MTKRRGDIARPDKRIAARIETLAFLFDVSVQTIANAVKGGKLSPSSELFGVRLYHVKTVEKLVFGLAEPELGDAGAQTDGEDPYLKGIRDATAGKQRAVSN